MMKKPVILNLFFPRLNPGLSFARNPMRYRGQGSTDFLFPCFYIDSEDLGSSLAISTITL